MAHIGVLFRSVLQAPLSKTIMDDGLRPPRNPISAWDFWIVLCRFSVPLSRTGHGLLDEEGQGSLSLLGRAGDRGSVFLLERL